MVFRHTIAQSLRLALLTLAVTVLARDLPAQSALCLSQDNLTKTIAFQPDELYDYLHLERYKAIFFGEQHNNSFDPQIKYHLITELNRRSGIRHVFMEMGTSFAWQANRYLQTSDTTFLTGPSGTYKPGPYTLFWKKLYDYNQQLPADARILIYGVDFERSDVFLTLKQLSSPVRPVPIPLVPVMDTICAHVSDPPLKMWSIINDKFVLHDNTAFEKTLRYVQSQLLLHVEAAKSYFGDNFPVVNDIIHNTGRVEVRPKRRNVTMFDALQKIVAEQKIEKFVGFFGGMHTSYAESNSLSNASKKLKGIKKEQILNIGEMAYDTSSRFNISRLKNYDELTELNGGCKATVISAARAYGFKRQADFVIIVNLNM